MADRRIKRFVGNVNVPQVVVQRASGGKYGQAAAGFLFANPVLALSIAAIGIALFLIFGSIGVGIFLEFMMNPWTWAISLLIGIVMKPGTNTVIGFSFLVGLLFWGMGIYQDYTAMQHICSIPIVGWIACGAWNIVTFVPKLFLLGLHIMVAFVQIWIVSFIKYELSR